MNTEQHLGAIFSDRVAAERAVEALQRLGLADEHLGVAVHEPDTHVFEEDAEADVAHGIETGIAIGAPIGAIAGMTLFAILVPGLGTMGIGGVLAGGAVTGALAGGFWGAYLGLTAEEHELDEEWDWERIRLQPGQVLIVATGHGHPREVADVLQRYGGTLVPRPAPIG